MNSIILKGSKIGNNVIIGAGSVGLSQLDDNMVYAGVPCKKIMSLDDFYIKRKLHQSEELQEITRRLSTEPETLKSATREYL